MLKIIWFWYSAGLSCAKVTKVAPKLLIAWAISQRIECIHLRSWEADRNAVDSIQYCSKAWRLANLARLVLALRIVYQDVKAWIHCQRIAGAGMGLAEVLNFPHLSQPAQANHSYLLKIATPVSAHVPTWTWSPAACSHYPALVQNSSFQWISKAVSPAGTAQALTVW